MSSSRREGEDRRRSVQEGEREWRPSQAPNQPISATWRGEVSGPVVRVGIDGEIRRGLKRGGPTEPQLDIIIMHLNCTIQALLLYPF